MPTRTFSVVVAILALAGSAHAANEQLVQNLKQLGTAVDNMAVNISNAESDSEAAQLARVTQETFATQLGGNPKPDVVVTASHGRCSVTITTPQWKLWSQAENGTIVDHGATIH
jgi:hypothetical protein